MNLICVIALYRYRILREKIITTFRFQTVWFFACNVVARHKLFGFSFATLLQCPNCLVSRLQRCCKAQTFWFLVCNVVARPKLFGFLFATLLQGANCLVSRLQQCCKAQTFWFLVCNIVARPKLFGFLFATLLQGPNFLVSCLQCCCKAQTKQFYRCGSSARVKPNSFIVAEVPQASNQTVSFCRGFKRVNLNYVLGVGARLSSRLLLQFVFIGQEGAEGYLFGFFDGAKQFAARCIGMPAAVEKACGHGLAVESVARTKTNKD